MELIAAHTPSCIPKTVAVSNTHRHLLRVVEKSGPKYCDGFEFAFMGSISKTVTVLKCSIIYTALTWCC